jgi:hypothetical protein
MPDLTFVDFAVYFGGKSFKRRLAESGEQAAIAWLDDPKGSFRQVYARMMTDDDRVEVRRRILAGEPPDADRIFSFAS